jgi:hypothetical protein
MAATVDIDPFAWTKSEDPGEEAGRDIIPLDTRRRSNLKKSGEQTALRLPSFRRSAPSSRPSKVLRLLGRETLGPSSVYPCYNPVEVASCCNYTAAGCWAQSFHAGVTINDLTMARGHYRGNWSSFIARRCGSTAHGRHQRSVHHVRAILLSSVIAGGFALGFDRVIGFATLLCAVR